MRTKGPGAHEISSVRTAMFHARRCSTGGDCSTRRDVPPTPPNCSTDWRLLAPRLPGGSGNAGKGSHLDGTQATDAAAGHTPLPGGSGNAEIGSHLDEEAATEGGCVPPAASFRSPPTKQRGPFPGVKMLFRLIVFSLLANGADAIAAAYPIGNRFDG